MKAANPGVLPAAKLVVWLVLARRKFALHKSE
jgi:hypothetical protein